MLETLTLIFLNILNLSLYLSDSLATDSTLNKVSLTDTTSLMDDSLVIEKMEESKIKIISFRVNSNQIFNYKGENDIRINERDTLSIVLQVNDKSDNIIFNYYFNENPNFRNIENGKILFDKTSKKIYFDFIPNNDQAVNKFLT